MGISREQALDCFRSDDLVGIGMEADAVRRRLHPEGVVSYVIDCAITQPMANSTDAWFNEIYDEIGQMIEMGGTGVRIVGRASGDNGDGTYRIEPFETLVRGIKQRFPSISVEGLSASDVMAMAAACGTGLQETIARLSEAGLDSITGEDIARPGASVREWLEVHRKAHELGMRTEAAMVFGAADTLEQRIDILEAVRRLQEETGGFTAFVPVAAEAPGGRDLDGVTAVERLKTLAISRMFLDNIENVQSSWAGQGLKVLQMGLRFGANDLGSVDAVGNGTAEEDFRRIIRDAGFKPVQRDSLYRTMLLT
jgi:cyclic dehypoxanthinyl futalosine synthase